MRDKTPGTQEEIEREIKLTERRLERLKNQWLDLQAEKEKAQAGFSEGDIVYVYEYADKKYGGRWHPVKVKRFFMDPSGSGTLGFSFTPIDKLGKSLMQWRQAYLSHGHVSIAKPGDTDLPPSSSPFSPPEWPPNAEKKGAKRK